MRKRWIVVTQIRSPIRRHRRQRLNLIALGLNRINRTKVLPRTPQVLGMIAKVHHLVRILDGPLLGEVTSEMKAQLETMRRFNNRVDRLERSGFWKRYEQEAPNVASSWKNVSFKKTGPATFEIQGRIYSAIENFDQDEINAFVLDYRQFTQNNDPISIGNLEKIYSSPWVSKAARVSFEEARAKLNRHRNRASVISFGDHPLMTSELVDTVVYGGLAHANREKAITFESWERSGIMGIIWAEFFAYLREFMVLLKFFRLLNTHVHVVADPNSME